MVIQTFTHVSRKPNLGTAHLRKTAAEFLGQRGASGQVRDFVHHHADGLTTSNFEFKFKQLKEFLNDVATTHFCFQSGCAHCKRVNSLTVADFNLKSIADLKAPQDVLESALVIGSFFF
jgi:hypothetical protein